MGSNLWNARFSKISKIRTWKIENLVEISMFFNEMVIRPTNKVQETHLWYWFFKPDRLVKVSDFFKWFQNDFFKNRLKLKLFWVSLYWLFYITCKIAWKKKSKNSPKIGPPLKKSIFLSGNFFLKNLIFYKKCNLVINPHLLGDMLF